jgi:hypothetical protein
MLLDDMGINGIHPRKADWLVGGGGGGNGRKYNIRRGIL